LDAPQLLDRPAFSPEGCNVNSPGWQPGDPAMELKKPRRGSRPSAPADSTSPRSASPAPT